MKKENRKYSKKRILAYLKKNFSDLKIKKDVLVSIDSGNIIRSDFYIPSRSLFLFITNKKSALNLIAELDCNTLVLSTQDCFQDWKKVKTKIKKAIQDFDRTTYNSIKSSDNNSLSLLEENIQGGFIYSETKAKEKYAERIYELEKQDRSGSEINELIGNPPGWLLRSGITVVSIVVGLIILLSSIIKYPDKISCQAELTSKNPPTPITSNIKGYVSDVLIKNNSLIEKGDKIFYIRNTANEEHVKSFNQYVQSLEKGNIIKTINDASEPQDLKLGPLLQPIFSQIILKVKEYKQLLIQNRTETQLKTLDREINKLFQLNQNMRDEAAIYDREIELVKKEFNRQKELYNEGIVSRVDLENAEAAFNQYLRDEINIKQGNIRNDIRIEELKLQKESLFEEQGEKINRFQFELLQLLTSWKTLYLEWQETYYIIAESSGKMELLSTFGFNSKISNNTLLGYIIPSNDQTNKQFARAYAPSIGRGKIKIGSKAIIKLDAYPYKEYGILISEVSNISTVTNIEAQSNFFYELIIPLEERIITDHKYEIPFSPNMKGTAEIITDDRSILNRIMSEFLGLLEE